MTNRQGTPSFTVAAIQMVSSTSIVDNLAEAAQRIQEAVAQKAQFILLPEYFAYMGRHDTDKLAYAEADAGGYIQDFMAKMAQQYRVWIAGAGVPLQSTVASQVKNSLLVFNPEGQRIARYDKIHLFGFQQGNESYQEQNTTSAGNTVVVVDTPFGRIGLCICYDIRFPELFRAMGKVDILLAPAAFTETTGRAHWEILLRARAIENQTFVLAAAQGGQHENGRETHGNTMLIDPWGSVLQRIGRGSGMICATINLEMLRSVRQQLPALEHRVL
jgi:nitrilase